MSTLPKLNFIIFGSTGDLARLKLLPALVNLWTTGSVRSDRFKLILVGRKEYSTVEYLEFIAGHQFHPFKQDISFLNPEYIQVDFDKQEGFAPLWQKIGKPEPGTKNLFYMSVGPKVLHLCLDRFTDRNSEKALRSYPHNLLLAEKPFGENLTDAVELNSKLKDLFGYPHVYRNDHYLFKDTVQSIMPIREQDVHMQNLLSPDYLKEIRLLVSEQVTVGDRAEYFDGKGVSIDWFQSHFLQVLSNLCADMNMENWRMAKSEFLSSLEIIPNSIIKAQYEGYQLAAEVADHSQTETFLAVRMKSNLPQWKDVVFSGVIGKGLDRKEVTISMLLRNSYGQYGDSIKLHLDPPGGNPIIEPAIKDEFEEIIFSVAHERLDKFVSNSEVEAQWQLTEKLRTAMRQVELQFYPVGTSSEQFCNDKWCRIS